MTKFIIFIKILHRENMIIKIIEMIILIKLDNKVELMKITVI